jgi:hypothetical protein
MLFDTVTELAFVIGSMSYCWNSNYSSFHDSNCDLILVTNYHSHCFVHHFQFADCDDVYDDESDGYCYCVEHSKVSLQQMLLERSVNNLCQ